MRTLNGKLAVSVKELATLFDCDRSTITKWAAHGFAVRADRGMYYLLETVTNVHCHFREVASGKGINLDAKEQSLRESAALKAAQRANWEVRTRKESGMLIDRKEMESILSEFAAAYRQEMIPLGERIAKKFGLPIDQWDACEDYVFATMQKVADSWLEIIDEHTETEPSVASNGNGAKSVEPQHTDVEAHSP